MSLLHRAMATLRLDGWMNLLSGVGTTTGRGDFRPVLAPPLDAVTIATLYRDDPFAKRVCRALPEDALRQGFGVDTEAALATRLDAQMDDLKAREHVREAWVWARKDGGAALLVGADDGQDPREPLDLGRVRGVRFVTPLQRSDLAATAWFDDPLRPDFGRPARYRVARKTGGRAVGSAAPAPPEVHASRLILFDGAPTTPEDRAQSDGWGASELQGAYHALQQFNGAWASTTTLMQDASQAVFKIKELYAMMVGDREDVLRKRITLLDLSRSIARAILIDAEDESFERSETSMAGLPELLDKYMLLLAGATEMPVTRLMGRSPAGLNATGESDVRSWYDVVQSARTNYLEPKLERLVKILMGPAEPANWSIKFPSLWQFSPTEEAAYRSTVAQTDAVYIQSQVVTPEEVALSRWRPEGYSAEMQLAREARAAVAAADLAAAQAPPAAPPTNGAATPPPTNGAAAPPQGP